MLETIIKYNLLKSIIIGSNIIQGLGSTVRHTGIVQYSLAGGQGGGGY